MKKNNDLKEEYLEIKDCPLSPEGWITFLSSEICRQEGFQTSNVTIILTFMVAFVGVMAGSLYALMNVDINLIPVFFPIMLKIWIAILCALVALLIFECLVILRTKKKIDPLEKLREDIIAGLDNPNEIRKRYNKLKETHIKRKLKSE